jgi:4-amino-4-deoxy-L-arabinose transferase-like glycosyltransferase
MTSFPKRITWQNIIIALLIMTVAVGLRGVLVYDRLLYTPNFIAPEGQDQTIYVIFAEALVNGQVPEAPYYFHPLLYYIIALVMNFMGTGWHSAVLTLIVLDMLTVGVMVALGWLLTKRAWGGYLAGMLFALYPMAMIYATTPLITTLSTFLVTLSIAITLAQRENLTLWRTALLGMVAGWIALSHQTLLIMGLFYLVWLFGQVRWTAYVKHGAVFGLGLVLMIAPFTYWNLYNGSSTLISTTGQDLIYKCNNRDNGGGCEHQGFAEFSREIEPIPAFIRDFQLDPMRFFTLGLRKVAMFFYNGEFGNNVSPQELLNASAMLRAIPLNYLVLLIGGVLGWAVLWGMDRRLALYFMLLFGWMLFSIVIGMHLSRLRFPVVAVYIPLTALLCIRLADTFRNQAWAWHPRYVLATVALVGIIAFTTYAVDTNPVPFPIKRTYATLPSDAIPLEIVFDNNLVLVGWKPLGQFWQSAETQATTINQAWGAELFWRVQQPTDLDYRFGVSIRDADTRFVGADQQVGGVSFPPFTTSQWQPDTIYGEIVSLGLFDNPQLVEAPLPFAETLNIDVGVSLRDENDSVINVQITQPYSASALTLQTLAIYPRNYVQATPEANALVFGNEQTGQIALNPFELPPTAIIGETLSIPLEWLALSDVKSTYTYFFHVMDANDQLATEASAALSNTLSTENWIPYFAVNGTLNLPMPSTPGTYRVYMGVINLFSTERLPIDAPDFRPLIAEIIVR